MFEPEILPKMLMLLAPPVSGLEHEVVEVDGRADGRAELEDPVDGVRDEAEREPHDRAPVERLAAPHEIGDRRDHERPVDDELRHPFPELRQPLLRLRCPRSRRDRRARRPRRSRARWRSCAGTSPRARRSLARNARRNRIVVMSLIPIWPREVPVHLLEGRDEERREEERRRDALEACAARQRPEWRHGGGGHATRP